MIKIERFDATDMLATDRLWIEGLIELNGNCVALEQLMDEAAIGLIQCYRITGDATGCFISRLLVNALGKQFDIWGLTGKGLIKHMKEFAEQVTFIARSEGCAEITGHVMRPGLERVYQRVAGRPDSVRYVKDIRHA